MKDRFFVANALDPDSYIRADFAVFGLSKPLKVFFEKRKDAEKVKQALLEARQEALREAKECAATYGSCPDDRGCEIEIMRMIEALMEDK